RQTMRGHITKRGKNSYSIAVSLGKDATTGKYKYQWVTVKGTKKDAEKRLSELLHQLDNGSFMKPSKTTLGEYLEKWLKDYVWPNLAPRTAEGYESIVHCHIKPALGSILLSQLKPEHLQSYYSDKNTQGLSNQTVRHHHTALHRALQMALEWDLLSRNPADAARPPRVHIAEIQTWDEDDMTKFFEVAKNSPYYAVFYTALFTGMRRSELLALQWSDIILLLCQVHVSRSLHVLKGGNIVFGSPKTAKGRRMIALTPSNTSVLREHQERQISERIFLGIPVKHDDFVFSHIDGSPLLPGTVSHAWIKLVHTPGVKPIRLHDARHTHASIMLKQGIHPKVVQERLGHSSIQITLDTYSHITPGIQEAAATRFDEGFSINYNKGEKEVV
ncbi:tyrosine-type recombinase/integrase, partial [Chloroflexota bacterium]